MCADDMHGCCSCPGPQGPMGVQGMQGPQGLQGPSGADGKSGPMGPMGPLGPMGAQGAKGDTGPTGPSGAAGPTGAPGPLGPKGNVGAQGVPGPQGPSGADGAPGSQGSVGLQGPQGVAGPQGIPGLQGPPGTDCECEGKNHGCVRYANLYAAPPQLLGPFGALNDTVIFGLQNAVSTGDFDLSFAGSSGDVKFLKSGVYAIRWEAEAKVEPPIPAPTPSFSFGIWINGVVVGGSVISGYTQAPNDDTLSISAEVMITLAAGDVLRLRNASSLTVNMNPNTIGIVFPVTVASLNIFCLKALP